jgi:hypothetical protein
MPALDEHLHRPWKPGGTMQASSQRARRRARGLPNWRTVRYADERARRRRSLRQAFVSRSNREELIFHDEVRDRPGRRHPPSW